MINPKTEDIGRKVVYVRYEETKIVDLDGTHWHREKFTEEGVITSFTNEWVFVRYGADDWSKATRRDQLEWGT